MHFNMLEYFIAFSPINFTKLARSSGFRDRMGIRYAQFDYANQEIVSTAKHTFQ